MDLENYELTRDTLKKARSDMDAGHPDYATAKILALNTQLLVKLIELTSEQNAMLAEQLRRT